LDLTDAALLTKESVEFYYTPTPSMTRKRKLY